MNFQKCSGNSQELIGGESGIRTHGRVSPTHAFQACSFNHSDISPCLSNQLFTGQWLSPKHRIVSEIVSDLLMCRNHLRALPMPASRRGTVGDPLQV